MLGLSHWVPFIFYLFSLLRGSHSMTLMTPNLYLQPGLHHETQTCTSLCLPDASAWLPNRHLKPDMSKLTPPKPAPPAVFPKSPWFWSLRLNPLVSC